MADRQFNKKDHPHALKKEGFRQLKTEVKPVTPVKSKKLSTQKKTNPTPFHADDSSDDILSSEDKQQFLLLEIKQLKRQNHFLKKKINDLFADFESHQNKKNKSKAKGTPKPKLETLHFSVNFFFEQIYNLMNSMVKLFRINFTEEEICHFYDKNLEEIEESCPIRKHMILKKYYLNRKLEMIMLQNESKRFPLFIDLFAEYYQFKEESDKKVIETIDQMTLRANELNKLLIEKAQEKKSSRTTFSQIKKEDDLHFDSLKITVTSPKNFVANNARAFAYTPSNKKNLKNNKFNMSPA